MNKLQQTHLRLGAGVTLVVEQGLAPDKALDSKMLNTVLGFINVRFAGEAHCSADTEGRWHTS